MPSFKRSYGVDLYFVRRYDEAIVQLQSALKTSPDLPFAHCVLGNAFNMKGIPEQALVAAEGCLGHYGPEVKDALARGYSEAGYRGAMRRVGRFARNGCERSVCSPNRRLLRVLACRPERRGPGMAVESRRGA